MNSIFNVFTRSPLKDLQKHMDIVLQCVQHIIPFMDAAMAANWDKAEQRQGQISELERQADEIKKEIRLSLPKSLFLPVPRTDILDILSSQDKVANKTKDIAGLILGRRMCIPPNIQTTYLSLLQRCLDAVNQAHKTVNELDDLLETGFRGNEVSLVEEMIETLGNIEHDTDEIQITVRSELFAMEKELNPIDAIFLYKVIEWTGDLADWSQRVGNCLMLLLAR